MMLATPNEEALAGRLASKGISAAVERQGRLAIITALVMDPRWEDPAFRAGVIDDARASGFSHAAVELRVDQR